LKYLIYVKICQEAKAANLCQNGDDPQPTKKFMKQKDLSRTEQCYVGITAIKANMTDTRLDLFISS